MVKKRIKIPRCAECNIKERVCGSEDGKGPGYCPTINLSDVAEAALLEYKKPDIKKFAVNATIQEGECYVNKGKGTPHTRYAIKPRVQETIEFAHKMGYKRLGIAFCGGLKKEAKILSEILKGQGFEAVSVICKTGRISKAFLGIKDEQKVNPGEFETMCNSITQAKVLNAANTEFNIIFGLCVGHDSLVMRYSDALCTVLVAKDRVTGHNPLAAINLYDSYYRKLKEEKFGMGGNFTITMKEN